MKKQSTIALAFTLLSGTALSGCGSDGTAGTPGTPAAETKPAPAAGDKPAEVKPFTVTLRHTQIGESKQARLKILQDAVKEAESKVPGLKFELDGVDSDVNRKEKLRAEMAAGNPPHIFDLFGGADTALYAKNGKLLELTDILTELGLKDKFINLSEFSVDGKVYGLPIGGFQEGFFYNKKVFDTLAIKPPKTWSELEAVAKQVKDAGKTPFAMASKQAWVPLMTANTLWSRYAGPDITSGFAKGTAKWNSPEMAAAFGKYQEWVKKGYFPKGELGFEYAEQRNQLITGQAAMMYDGSWASSVFKDPKQAGDMVGQVGYFPMPPVDGGKGDQTAVNAGFSNGYGFSANLKDNELKAVKAFIAAQYNEKMQLRGVIEDNVLPSMKIKPDGVDPLLKEIIDAGNNAKSTFPAFDALVQPDVNSALSDGIQQLISGVYDAQKMLDKVQEAQDKANRAAK
ncbi:extracellular solute-binding protein [Paenibacillus chartarius]|uniref:Extracellular solute-binding protein n=1 Tax=Paenibacillus chartarius TaxID=747481 RepID=A0ABV6DH69_9BACL